MPNEELVGGRECRVVIDVRVPFEQIPNNKSEFRRPGLSFLLLFNLRAIGVLCEAGPTLVNMGPERWVTRGDHLLPLLRQRTQGLIERVRNDCAHEGGEDIHPCRKNPQEIIMGYN